MKLYECVNKANPVNAYYTEIDLAAFTVKCGFKIMTHFHRFF